MSEPNSVAIHLIDAEICERMSENSALLVLQKKEEPGDHLRD